jgi:carbon-monoxide dehydrogenase medium subunit
VGAAALVHLAPDGRIEWARLAFTGVGDKPTRAHQAEQALRGQSPTEDVVRAVGELSIADLTPESDLHASAEYRRDVAKVIARRTLMKAIERSRTASQ